MKNKIIQLTETIKRSQKILVFTGAGISTESGISDYRSKGGLWDRYRPVTIQDFQTSQEKRKEYWQIKTGLLKSLKEAQPNDGHKAIVELERMGKLRGLITQNIDGLHQLAGTSQEKIIKLHGTIREIICLSCGDLNPWQETCAELKRGVAVPLCHKCGGFLKPNTISFGQALNPIFLQKAMDWADDCDFILVLGSTLIVEPAASIPRIAQSQGARLCIITKSPTPMDTTADLKIEDSCGLVLKNALAILKKVTVE